MSCLMINDLDAGVGRFGKSSIEHASMALLIMVDLHVHSLQELNLNFLRGWLVLVFFVQHINIYSWKPPNFFMLLLLPGNTQMTVNNQIVVGTLMNLADNPTRVSIGQKWRESDITHRVPIIATGNDFSTLYAPLIRDGRMEKFYWYVCSCIWSNHVDELKNLNCGISFLC